MRTAWKLAIVSAMFLLAANAAAADRWVYLSAYPLDQSTALPDASIKGGDLAWYAADADYTQAYTQSDEFWFVVKKGGVPVAQLHKISLPVLREMWTTGETLHAAYVFPAVHDKCPTDVGGITITPTPRKTAFESGLATLGKLILKVIGGAAPTPICMVVDVKVLKDVRANVVIEYKKGDKSLAELDFITGPEEHLFFSADVVSKGASQLKIDPDKGTVTEKENPKTVYVALNYMWGDVYARGLPRFDYRRLVLRGQIEISKDPLHSFGTGIAYRFHEFGDPKATGGLMVFVSSMWSKPDTSSGGPDTGKRKQSWRVGIAYSLDAALDWVGKK